VLLVAYACRPGESSEREVGWQWANLIQAHHNVTVLTRTTHRPYIESMLASQAKAETEPPEFIYYDLPNWASWFKRGERGLYVYYTLWSIFATRLVRRLNRDGRWQITHFLTFGTLLWPQFTWATNTPFYVLGPVGGGERIPLCLRKSFELAGQVKILLRRFSQKAQLANPIFHATLRKANKIFARTNETLDLIPKQYHHKAELLLETALTNDLLARIPAKRENACLEIISVGRLITSKFNPLFLESIAAFKQLWKKPFRVTILGDGPERVRLENLRDRLGLDEVVFLGKKPHNEVLSALRRSDVYFSTTMKEGGSWAFFEAISCGVPVVCLKVNGPDMILGDGCGIKVAVADYATTCNRLADGLHGLAKDSNLRADLSRKAHAFIACTYTWEHVAERIDAAYAELLAMEAADL
jgi:glycosyltransferase involved in cell wall biosynthesis